jgi:signal transduction histidine kinase
MNLSKFSKEVEESRPELASRLTENAAIARAVSDELRRIQRKKHIEVSLNLSEDLERLPPDLELMIFRVVQECLTKHSSSFRQCYGRNFFVQLDGKTHVGDSRSRQGNAIR